LLDELNASGNWTYIDVKNITYYINDDYINDGFTCISQIKKKIVNIQLFKTIKRENKVKGKAWFMRIVLVETGSIQCFWFGV
jgi:hypothetical protein